MAASESSESRPRRYAICCLRNTRKISREKERREMHAAAPKTQGPLEERRGGPFQGSGPFVHKAVGLSSRPVACNGVHRSQRSCTMGGSREGHHKTEPRACFSYLAAYVSSVGGLPGPELLYPPLHRVQAVGFPSGTHRGKEQHTVGPQGPVSAAQAAGVGCQGCQRRRQPGLPTTLSVLHSQLAMPHQVRRARSARHSSTHV